MLNGRLAGLVSIIVPCFNRERYIKECLDSLIQQSYQNIEIIIVDDASTDKSRLEIQSWMKSIEQKAPHFSLKERVQLLTLPRNVGFSGAVTTAMFLSQGEFIAMQDSDDLSHSDRIMKQIQFLQSNPHVGVVGTVYATFSDGRFDQQKKANWIRFGEQIKQAYANGKHCVCHGTILFHGHIFDKLGGLNRRHQGAEDFEFIARCISKRITIDNLPEVLYYYRKHGDQRSRQFYGKKSDNK